MLIVIGILLILMVMTVTAVNVSMNADRVRGGVRQVQSYLQGARDRAIYAKEDRGVRFLVDRSATRTSTSMVFIAPTPPWKVGTVQLERMADGEPVTLVRGSAGSGWLNLARRGLITGNQRIKILDASGTEYTASPLSMQALGGRWKRDATGTMIDMAPDGGPPGERGVDDDGNGIDDDFTEYGWTGSDDENLLVLHVPYRGPVRDGVVATGQLKYELELPATPLPNQEPVLLPTGCVVDLDGSHVPQIWRPVGGTAAPYSSQMDIMFSPRGVVTGPAAGTGLIHLLLTEGADLEQSPGRPIDWSSPPVVPLRIPLVNLAGEPLQSEKILLTIFTRTGNISTHPVDITDISPTGPNGFADDPFRFAETGEVAGQ